MPRRTSKPTLTSILERRRNAVTMAQDFTDGASARDRDAARPSASPTGWISGTLLGALAVIGIVAAVVTVPVVLECRNRTEQGLFAGQTYGGCVSAGSAARWRLLESRATMIVLGSGR